MNSIIKKNRVQVDASGPIPAPLPGRQAPAGPAPPTCEKRVQLLELEGRVHAIELVCSCGERTIVELDYPRPAATPAVVPSTEEAA